MADKLAVYLVLSLVADLAFQLVDNLAVLKAAQKDIVEADKKAAESADG